MLLNGQDAISKHFPMPVDIVNDATRVTDVAAESVQLVVASTNVNDAGSAAGTVVFARIANGGILDSAKSRIASKEDTSFAFVTGTILDVEVNFPHAIWEDFQLEDRATKMAAVGALLANGQFCIDYQWGLLIGKKKTTGTSDTANYSYRSAISSATVVGTVTVDSEFPAAGAASDNFANPTTTNVMAMGMVFDGATWDRQKGDSTDGTLVNLGTNNDVTVTGSVTANAGTNLNTSLLALEAGGNLAAAATSLATLDDIVAGNEAQVDVITLPAITGTVTANAGTNLNTSLLALEAGGNLAAAATSLATLDNVVSGNEAQVDIVTLPPPVIGTGTLANPAEEVVVINSNGHSAVGVQVTGTWTGQLEFEVSVDGTNYAAHDLVNNATDAIVNATAANGIFFAGIAAYQKFRVRASALSSGGAIVTVRLGAGVESVHLESPLPAGSAVIGQVTANAGTNLNTSLLALEAGGNLAASATSLAILDDWDESDRCKVNPIAGQAGVQGASGTISALTQRVTVATDDTVATDLTSVRKSTSGAGAPVIDSYTSIPINLAAGADQSLVSAPGANKQIWVYGYGITVNVAGTVSIQDEDNTAITGIMQFGATGGISVPPSGNFAMPVFKVATNKALEVDIVTSELDGWLTYAVVSV